MRRLILFACLFTGWLLALPAVALDPGGSFIDDDGNGHEGAIEAVRVAGITQGCHPIGDLYCPSRSVTRGEMAVFIIRGLGETTPPFQGTFSDVPEGRFYTGAVERLAQLEIATGYPDGTFRPDAGVSRAEMAAFLVRALGEADSLPSFEGRFDDVPAGAWYTAFVERLAQLEVTTGCSSGPPLYCPHDAVRRDQMASFLARAFDLPVEPVPARPSVQGLSLRLETVSSGFEQPVFVVAPPGDDRIFVVDQPGRVWIVSGGQRLATPFLDIADQVRFSGEQGLFALAFHPDYSSNGLLYVHYTNTAGDTRLVEYRVSDDPDVADESTARVLLSLDQPASNHNGGMIRFGPDGRLYIGLGDGGGGGDTFGNGQNLGTLFATITRIDVDGGGAPEIFAYGLRNPWRFSFDGERIYIADVGQAAWEEVDVVTLHETLTNFGWPIMEGSHCFRTSGCSSAGLALPVVEYSHSRGCSITGGFVYRGSRIPDLQGHYLYGDFCSGRIWSFRYAGGSGAVDSRLWPFTLDGLTSFGLDSAGEIYLTSTDGTVRRLAPG